MLQDEDIYTFFKSGIVSSKVSQETRSKSSSIKPSLKKKKLSSNVLDGLKKGNYFSVAIGQAHTKARYVVDSSHDVVDILQKLAVVTTAATSDSFSWGEVYLTRKGNADSKRWIHCINRRELAVGDTELIDM